MSEQFEAGHLGGYTIGGDPATFYPDLWRWVVENLKIKTVIDVGCGEGHALDYFKSLGVEATGIEGCYSSRTDVINHDYTKDPLKVAPYDLCWCCEFVEHVEEKYMPNFMATFKGARWILMTHAEPGQGGYHHVNCRPAEYWKGALAAIGFSFDPVMTHATRTVSEFNTNPYNHYRRSGMVFRQF